jgi:DNA polymerase-3 subunit delta'
VTADSTLPGQGLFGRGLLGQERPVEILAAALASDRLPHALLLTGPRQVGKRTLALALASALTCSAPAAPCGACRACRLIADAGFPDVHLLELREGRQRIGIKDVQALRAELARRPSESRHRVAVIVDAERLSSEAENALLKTLEEPPSHAYLVLTTEDAASLLPTTVSRCRQLRLRPVSAARIAEHLEQRHGLEPAQAERLASLAGGRPGWAIAAASDPGRLERYEAALARLARAREGGKLARLEIARELAERWSSRAEEVREELRIWAGWWRALLRRQLGLDHDLPAEALAEVEREARRFSPALSRQALRTLVQAAADLDQNVNPRLALDLALLRLPAAGRA